MPGDRFATGALSGEGARVAVRRSVVRGQDSLSLSLWFFSQNPYLYADFRLLAPKYTYTALEGGFESASTDINRIVAIIIIAQCTVSFRRRIASARLRRIYFL